MANTDRLPNSEDMSQINSLLDDMAGYISGDYLKAMSWANASDSQLVLLLEKAYAGEIDLSRDCGWAVGDERVVHLSAMAATDVGESHAEQDVTFVLMNRGGYTLTNGNECQFVVGMKNCLAEKGYMNSTNTNSGSWRNTARRSWCNNVFRNALPSTFRSLFREFNCITAQSYNGSSNQTTQDYFALPAAAEVFKGDPTWGQGGTAGNQTASSNLTEFNALNRWTWYETTANRFKTLGNESSANMWWERSPAYNTSLSFCYANEVGGHSYSSATYTHGLSPFGCI